MIQNKGLVKIQNFHFLRFLVDIEAFQRVRQPVSHKETVKLYELVRDSVVLSLQHLVDALETVTFLDDISAGLVQSYELGLRLILVKLEARLVVICFKSIYEA